MKWIWNPLTAWQLSSYVTIFQMAWFRELFPATYNWIMDLAAPLVRGVNDYAVAAWDVVVEVFWNTS